MYAPLARKSPPTPVRPERRPNAGRTRRERDTERSLAPGRLRLGGVQDPSERAADRVASRVVHDLEVRGEGVPDPAPPAIAPGGGGRPVALRFEHDLRRRCAHEGRPLDDATRRRMEPQFAFDLSAVRIHDDTGAAALTRRIGARAFTFDNHIFFGHGERARGGAEATRLLAHELAHVQQGAGRGDESRIIRRAVDPGQYLDEETASGHDETYNEDLNVQSAPPTEMERLTRTFKVLRERGLPMHLVDAFLASGYDVAETLGNEEFATFLNVVRLHGATLDAGAQMEEAAASETMDNSMSRVGSLYHELTHAYLDMMARDPNVSLFMRRGTAQYRDAPLKDGEPSSDPARVFEEAVAVYVSGRVFGYVQAYNELTIAARVSTPEKWVAHKLAEAERFLAQDVPAYGYEERGLFSPDQVQSSRPLPETFRQEIDKTLLRGLPRTISESKQLAALLARVHRNHPRAAAASPSK